MREVYTDLGWHEFIHIDVETFLYFRKKSLLFSFGPKLTKKVNTPPPLTHHPQGTFRALLGMVGG